MADPAPLSFKIRGGGGGLGGVAYKDRARPPPPGVQYHPNSSQQIKPPHSPTEKWEAVPPSDTHRHSGQCGCLPPPPLSPPMASHYLRPDPHTQVQNNSDPPPQPTRLPPPQKRSAEPPSGVGRRSALSPPAHPSRTTSPTHEAGGARLSNTTALPLDVSLGGEGAHRNQHQGATPPSMARPPHPKPSAPVKLPSSGRPNRLYKTEAFTEGGTTREKQCLVRDGVDVVVREEGLAPEENVHRDHEP